MARSGFRTGLLRGRLTAFFVAVTLGLPICVGATDTAPERESWGKLSDEANDLIVEASTELVEGVSSERLLSSDSVLGQILTEYLASQKTE